ncbi:hypothetical protein UPYG_G00171400 [Umbra pygmaea]|uniref:Uncharacterized protein n=1 Tax=Umbra pygmaea TaxID=75934 RepID=A0ABD0WTD3_UMBPY
MLAFALLFIATHFHSDVVAQNDGELNVVTGLTKSVDTGVLYRGDDTDKEQKYTFEVHTIVFPDIPDLGIFGDTKTIVTTATDDPIQITTSHRTMLIPKADVMCVRKEDVQDRDAVSLKLKTSSNCEETRTKIKMVLEHLCGDDCKLEVFQEDNSNEILISGKYIEDDVKGMAEKFNNDNIKDKIDLEEAVPRWGKNSKLVLVSLLLAGILLALLLIAGYYLKTHRPPPKGAMAEDVFQVDEENQANTLVSVAPLQHQGPLDKPTINGEAPESQQPPTNGHFATQTSVADTEM